VRLRIERIEHGTTKKIFLSCCSFALWTACHVGVAQAHASLLQTQPTSGSQLAEAPDKVRLSFNERVEAIFNSIEVLDQEGNRVDDGNARVVGEGDTLELGLKALGDGKYTVLWRVNSLDGHQVQGHFGFGVKSAPPNEASMNHLSVPQESLPLKVYALVAKWIGLTAMMIWLGAISFWIVVLRPSLPVQWQTEGGQQALIFAAVQRTCRILWSGAIAFFIAQFLSLVAQGMIFANLPLMEALSPSTIRTLLTMTSYGQWWSLRMLAAFGLLSLCAWKMRPSVLCRSEDGSFVRSSIPLALGSGVMSGLILLTIPMNGHARAVSQATALAVGCDWAHLGVTAIWIGGLVFLWAVVLVVQHGQDEKPEFLSKLVSRFSRMARICVLVLLVTGIYSAWLHIPSWRAFVSTDYGVALLIKLFLVILILLIAAVNWRRVLPALAGFSLQPETYRKWAGRFRNLIRTESLLGVAILVAVAFLTSLPPATAVALAGPLDLSKRNEDMVVNLKLDSSRVGTVHSVVTLQDLTGRTISDAKRVTLFVRMLDMDMALETVEAQATPSGTFQADIVLGMTGKWSISVQVSPPHGDTFVAQFDIFSGI
jgi:copper transport protein